MQQPAEIPWATVPEEFVLGELLKSSKRFATFYDGERKKIPKPVHWAEDRSLPTGIACRCSELPRGAHLVRLRRIPAEPKDAIVIAHELQHLVLVSAGFPLTGAKEHLESISAALNSMAHDPLVSSVLQTYGFDCLSDHNEELKEAFHQLQMAREPPSNHLGRMQWIFNYVGQVLNYERISRQADETHSEFRAWFEASYPSIAREAEGLLALIDDVGFDTPSEQRTLFKEVIRRYHLNGVIFLQPSRP